MNKISKWLLIILLILVLVFLSWFITTGIIKLICLCFSFRFSWKIATGIWLVLVLVGNFVRSRR